jgi:uncharacterized damage-inducible protein DinB
MQGNIENDFLAAWETNNRITEFFFENLPDHLWSQKIPGAPLRTVRMIAGHIHNARCMWIKMIGKQYGIKFPKSVDRRQVNRRNLLHALKQSNKGIIELLKIGLDNKGFLNVNATWANIPSDVIHFMTYMIAHEAHHRGQIVFVARALGHRLSPEITNGLWQWKKRQREAGRI